MTFVSTGITVSTNPFDDDETPRTVRIVVLHGLFVAVEDGSDGLFRLARRRGAAALLRAAQLRALVAPGLAVYVRAREGDCRVRVQRRGQIDNGRNRLQGLLCRDSVVVGRRNVETALGQRRNASGRAVDGRQDGVEDELDEKTPSSDDEDALDAGQRRVA